MTSQQFGLTKVVIFQVGDIHFPTVQANKPDVDYKDSGFPDPSVFQGSNSRMDIVSNRCAKLAKKNADAVLFMGDLTTNGSAEGLRDCVRYLSNGVANYIATKDDFNKKFMFVPGNHDVERPIEVTKDFSSDGYLKFKMFHQGLRDAGFENTSAMQLSKISIDRPQSVVEILGINTCLGCGELRVLPTEIQDEVTRTIRQLISEVPGDAEMIDLNKEFISRVSERIDAAIIDPTVLGQITNVFDERADGANGYVPIVVGHHNLLPQTTPRISTYSEMVNSGKLRSLLQSYEFPVVYLHGHIHDDPVEIISSSEGADCGIISISAPLFEDGFNILEVYFDSSGVPLGLTVERLRFDRNGQKKRIPKSRIPFQFGRFRLARTSPLCRDIFNILQDRGRVYFSDLCLEVDKVEGDVAAAVMELEWLGSVDVVNQDKPPRNWMVSVSV